MINRIEPALPPTAYQTYQAVRPRSTHTKPATCQEVDCQAYANGWTTTVDTSTELGRRQANYIRLKSGRRYRSWTHEASGKVEFVFPPGQKCFADHRVPIDRPTLYLRRGGDWRATTIEPVRLSEANWIDDFANHQNKLAEQAERG